MQALGATGSVILSLLTWRLAYAMAANLDIAEQSSEMLPWQKPSFMSAHRSVCSYGKHGADARHSPAVQWMYTFFPEPSRALT